jgi:DNA-binding IclR family transcriptional regulator
MQFINFGTYVRDQYRYNDQIQPKVSQLAEETGKRSQYILEEHGIGIYLHRERGDAVVKTDARVGKTIHLHAASAGKAILAQQSDDRITEIIDMHGLVPLTENTITDREEFFEEINEVRERGYALNQEEHVTGLVAGGVHITNPEGKTIGGLSVSGPTHRIMPSIEDGSILNTLFGIKDEIELNLSYS